MDPNTRALVLATALFTPLFLAFAAWLFWAFLLRSILLG